MICLSSRGVFFFCFSFCRRPKEGLEVDFDLECFLVYYKTSCTFMLVARTTCFYRITNYRKKKKKLNVRFTKLHLIFSHGKCRK